ncbi:MAG: sulfite exporter TauE/SafE family protein [Spirochaetes bacterium]|nr:sulfite exporter TauE/SafE family protein [Spirochaetota bacterium]MCK5512438.1 sulfite exporter TauE/SafE family protein [Thermodesulfovibrionia bacterium]
MPDELLALVIAAASIGFFHTLLGPDHYLPFIVMSRSGRWSLLKTTVVTVLCGTGHVLSSIALGILGITFGFAVSKLEAVESFRGNVATWALIAFGLIYFVWGMRIALRHKSHEHVHIHVDGINHAHNHNHIKEHMHVHDEKSAKSITPWVLFTIFVLGPCELLIPMLMYPAAKSSLSGLLLVSGVFGVITVLTMLSIVLVSTFGINLVHTARLERYTHAIAGAILCFCGISILFFGL